MTLLSNFFQDKYRDHTITIVTLLVCFQLYLFYRIAEEAAISEISDLYILDVFNSLR